MRTPSGVLATILRSDPGRPRATFYDDSPGAAGERVELSAKVLANWVSKAANALQDEWDLGPGSRVRLDLPPHWRALYWGLATWSVGAVVVLEDEPADLVVTADPATAELAGSPAILVTLTALARSAPSPVPAGSMDEARELATFGDQFAPWEEPAADDLAMSGQGDPMTYESVVPHRSWPQGVRVHIGSERLRGALLDALAAWAVDGSIVISRGPEPAGGRARRLASEGVTLET